jgi:allophanate hydrolase subunit 2
VTAAGLLTTVQDRGRFGWTGVGVPTSGAADRPSAALANRVLGNPDDAALLEITLGGFRAVLEPVVGDTRDRVLDRAHDPTPAAGAGSQDAPDATPGRWCSLTGAPAPVSVGDVPVPDPALFWVPEGAEITVAAPRVGLRSYLGVSGGIDVDPVLGSRATDTLSGLGPPVVTDGTVLPLGPASPPGWDTDLAVSRIPTSRLVARFRWGPREAVFPPADRGALLATTWTVSASTSRVGARLAGPPLTARHGSLRSEGTGAGSIQVPPSGEPIVFLADRPVTGGYPVIGVVVEPDIAMLAQARPGTRVRFEPLLAP